MGMLDTFHIGVSPLTGCVYLGKVLKQGLWSSTKKDVTSEFTFCAIQKWGPPLGKDELSHIVEIDGKPEWEIIVRRVKP